MYYVLHIWFLYYLFGFSIIENAKSVLSITKVHKNNNKYYLFYKEGIPQNTESEFSEVLNFLVKDTSALRESADHEKGLNSNSLRNVEPPVITSQPTWESVLDNAEKSEEYRKVSFSIMYL